MRSRRRRHWRRWRRNAPHAALAGLALVLWAMVALAVRHTGSSHAASPVPTYNPIPAYSAPPLVPPRTPARSGLPLYVTAIGKPDGPVGKADTGQSALVLDNRPLRYHGGLMVHDNAGVVGHSSAGAVEYTLPTKITRVGMTAVWKPGATGALSLLVPSAPWRAWHRPDSAVHLVVWGDGRWQLSTLTANDTAEEIYLTNETAFTFPDIRDGKPHTITVDIYWQESRVLVTLPNGQRASIHDNLIHRLPGSSAIFELYELNRPTVDAPAAIQTVWAG